MIEVPSKWIRGLTLGEYGMAKLLTQSYLTHVFHVLCRHIGYGEAAVVQKIFIRCKHNRRDGKYKFMDNYWTSRTIEDFCRLDFPLNEWQVSKAMRYLKEHKIIFSNMYRRNPDIKNSKYNPRIMWYAMNPSLWYYVDQFTHYEGPIPIDSNGYPIYNDLGSLVPNRWNP
jgi:hypothetical protein